MKSTRMWMVTLRRAASVRIRSSWWRAPSTSTIQVRRWVGSRCWAWSKTAAMPCWLLVAIDPVSHLAVATGPWRRRRPPPSPAAVALIVMARDGRGHDIVGPAGRRVGVVDRAQGRHPLTALLLPAGQPSAVAVGTLGLGGLAGGLAQRLGTQH